MNGDSISSVGINNGPHTNWFQHGKSEPYSLLTKGAMMNMRMILMLTLFSMSATVPSSDAATVFSGSRIIAIDQGQRTITFKTREGETWTLPVTDPDLLNRQPIAKDEQVTIEIDLNDRITNVAKASETRAAPRTETEDR